MKTCDVVVIGSGPGGYVAAIRCAQDGKKVIIVEKEKVGGVCLNIGCIPSKALIHASETYQKFLHAQNVGITVDGIKLNPEKLQSWKNEVVEKLTGGIQQLLKAHKIELVSGTARFQDQKTLIVKKIEEETIQFSSAIIATGSSPFPLKGFEPDGDLLGTSTDGLSYNSIPKRLCVIGGGYIGLELGSLYAGFGSKVTVVEATGSLLPGTDRDLVKIVEKELKERDVKIYLNSLAQKVEKNGKQAVVTIKKVNLPSPQSGREGEAPWALPAEGATRALIIEEKLTVDKVLVAVGRVPNTKGLGLEELGVRLTEKGFIQVNERQKTNIPGIYAIGDCAGGALLAHKSSKEGLVAAAVINGEAETFDVKAMPAVIFTSPEIAYVGLSAEEAKQKGYEVKTARFPFQASGKAIATNHTEGFVKIISDAKSDVVLGVAMVGADVSSLIGEACLAIEMGATTEDIARTVHPHPTLTETLMEGAEAIHGRAIHIFQR